MFRMCDLHWLHAGRDLHGVWKGTCYQMKYIDGDTMQPMCSKKAEVKYGIEITWMNTEEGMYYHFSSDTFDKTVNGRHMVYMEYKSPR